MPTTRIPLKRQQSLAIPDQAIYIWRRMRKLHGKCTCEAPIAGSTKTPDHDECPACVAWYQLHGRLHEMLGLKPWVWPCLLPPSLDPEYDYERNLYTGRMLMERAPEPRMVELDDALRAADRELRKRARVARIAELRAQLDAPTLSSNV